MPATRTDVASTLRLMAFELPQDGIVALRETETLHQPLRRPPPGHMADQVSEFAHPAGSPGERSGNPRNKVGKRLPQGNRVKKPIW